MIAVTGVSKDYHSETRHTYHRVLSNIARSLSARLLDLGDEFALRT